MKCSVIKWRRYGKQESALDGWMANQSARFEVQKKKKIRFDIFSYVSVSVVMYGHECCAMTERLRSRIQELEINLPSINHMKTLPDKVTSSEIKDCLQVDTLILCIAITKKMWLE